MMELNGTAPYIRTTERLPPAKEKAQLSVGGKYLSEHRLGNGVHFLNGK